MLEIFTAKRSFLLQDGSNRRVILKGDSLKHPVSLDVFESSIYWTTRRTGELIRQDKFGRGVPQVIVNDIPRPGGVRVYHPLRYNVSLRNLCHEDQCTHLCVPVPGGHRCLCSDSIGPLQQKHDMRTNERHCDATNERPLPAPRICPCRNGGLCQEAEGNKLQCACPAYFHGEFCEVGLVAARSSNATAAIVIPIVISVLVLLGAAAVIMVLKKRPL